MAGDAVGELFLDGVRMPIPWPSPATLAGEGAWNVDFPTTMAWWAGLIALLRQDQSAVFFASFVKGESRCIP